MSNDQPSNPGSTPQSPAPAGRPAPVTPRLDLSHESPEVAAVMSDPRYFNGTPAERKALGDQVFSIRSAQNAPRVATGDEPETSLGASDKVEGFSHTAAEPETGIAPADMRTAVFPSSVPAPVRQTWATLATEVGIGPRELSSIAKAAAPFLGDNKTYTFESGERALREQLGAKADEALRDAKTFVGEFPEILRVLKQRNLANHPAVVRVLAERWKARDGLQSKAKEARAHPQFFGPKSGQGNVDHEMAARLASEVESLMAELYS